MNLKTGYGHISDKNPEDANYYLPDRFESMSNEILTYPITEIHYCWRSPNLSEMSHIV